jgi:superfamily II DNA/RNA helicase
LIIATPGRLLMHLEETRGFADRCSTTSCLILDEADRLLDMGFKADIDKIASFLKPTTAGVSLP